MKIAILNIALLAITVGTAAAQIKVDGGAVGGLRVAVGPEPSSAILAALAGAFALALRRR